MRLAAGLIRYERQKLDRMQTLMSNHADLFDYRQRRAYKRRIQRQRELWRGWKLLRRTEVKEMRSDSNFEFVRVTFPDGKISGVFLYKPQMILCTSFITMELAHELGWKVESNMEKNDNGVISIVIETDKDKDRKE